MKILKAAAIAWLMIPLATNAWAMDWKPLHEKADTETYEMILTESQKDPASPEKLYTLALSCLNLYKISEVRAAFEKMLAMDPESIEARWGLAELARRRHESKEARKVLEEIIEKDPGYAPAYVTLAYIFFDKRNFDDAMRMAFKVIHMGRKNVDLTNIVRAYLLVGGSKGMIANKGSIWTKLIQGPQVMGYLKKAQSLQPENADVYFGLGSFYCLAPKIAGGDRKKGISYLEKAIERDPHLTVGYARLAQVWRRLGNKEKYRFYLEKAIALDPEESMVKNVKSMVR
jgi:tetratricopeptide (TPR) repeat protein